MVHVGDDARHRIEVIEAQPRPDPESPIGVLRWHSHAEYVAVVSGEATLVLGADSHSLSPGSYIVIPAGMNHSWDVPAGDDSVILVRCGGPADFNFVGR